MDKEKKFFFAVNCIDYACHSLKNSGSKFFSGDKSAKIVAIVLVSVTIIKGCYDLYKELNSDNYEV